MGHWMVKSPIATTPLMNRLILMGDDLMGYGKTGTEEPFLGFFGLYSNALLMWTTVHIRTTGTPFTLKIPHVEQDFQYEYFLPNMAKRL
jgi:hypothetical protein